MTTSRARRIGGSCVRTFLAGVALWVPAAFLDAPVAYTDADVPRFELASSQPAPDRQVLAVAIGGTGARALAAIGVLKSLEAAGVRPNLVVGSGTGAVVAVLYAAGYSGADLEEIALQIPLWRLVDPVLSQQGVVRGAALRRWLDNLLDARRIEDLGRPFAAVVTHFETGTLEILNRGRASVAALASSAVAGVLFPVRIDGESLGDGQVVSPVPVRVARQLGADLVIAIDVEPPVDTAPAAMRHRPERLAMLTLKHSLIDLEVDESTVLVQPELGWRVGVGLAERRRAIVAGEAAGLDAIEQLRGLVQPAPGSGRQAGFPAAPRHALHPPLASTRQAL
jgi:NTE family protein